VNPVTTRPGCLEEILTVDIQSHELARAISDSLLLRNASECMHEGMDRAERAWVVDLLISLFRREFLLGRYIEHTQDARLLLTFGITPTSLLI
jgi:hypothetical protein